jgi:hypothetical protein
MDVSSDGGARGGDWDAQQGPEALDELYLSRLGLNQCVSAGIDGHGHTLYTHRCDRAPKGGAK